MKISMLKILVLLISCELAVHTEAEISKSVDEVNRALDRAVVQKDIVMLNKHYGEDFVFTHGTGQIDSKKTWVNHIQTMKAPDRFASREHDSTQVELHGDIAIVTGKLSVVRETKDETRKYALWYVRVFALRKKVWQLISHRTTKEWHL